MACRLVDDDPPALLSASDKVMLDMSQHNRNGYISLLFWLEGSVNRAQVEAQMERLCLQQPRLRQIPMGGTFWQLPHWQDMSAVNKASSEMVDTSTTMPLSTWQPADNIEERWLLMSPLSPALVETADPIARTAERERAALETCYGQFFSQLIDDSTRPLWRARLIHGLTGQTALALAVHHGVTDGLGLLHAIRQTMSLPVDTMTLPVITAPHPLLDSPDKLNKLQLALPSLTLIRQQCFYYSERVLLAVVLILRLLLHFIVGVALMLSCLVRLLFFQRGTRLLADGAARPTGRDTAWTHPLPLSEVQSIRTVCPGSTLNDVVLAVLERAYGRTMGDQLHDQAMLLQMPMGCRAPHDTRFANLACISYVFLPITTTATAVATAVDDSDDDTVEQRALLHGSSIIDWVTSARDSATAAKRSLLTPFFAFLSRYLYGSIPGFIDTAGLIRWVDKCHALVSNMPGPQEPLYFAGQHRVLDFVVHTPDMGPGALSIGISSYCGQLRVAISADADGEQVSLARRMIEQVERAFHELHQAAQVVLVSSP